MARNNPRGRPAAAKSPRGGRGKPPGGSAAAARTSVEPVRDNTELPEWDEVSDELAPIPDIDGMLDKPAANQGSDPMARRRIEMLREERLLQQALSDGFDL